MTECITWNCTRPGIAHLVVRRPCGHPVALNSSGLGPSAIDGSRPAYVQRQWSCGPCILRRAGTSAPGPSTCPVCEVREPVTVDPLMHVAFRHLGDPVCGSPGLGWGHHCTTPEHRRAVTCPGCLEWLHA